MVKCLPKRIAFGIMKVFKPGIKRHTIGLRHLIIQSKFIRHIKIRVSVEKFEWKNDKFPI